MLRSAERRGDVLALAQLVAAFIADLAIIGELFAGRLTFGSALLWHFALLALTSVAIFIAPRRDQFSASVALSLAAFLGPAGLLMGIFLGGARAGRSRSTVLDRWRDWADDGLELDKSVRLAEQIETGRAARSSVPPSRLFGLTTARGCFAEKQWMLGAIARNYHPAYSQTLAACVRDSEPGLRVLAAAVRAQLMARSKIEFNHLMRRDGLLAAEPNEAITTARRMIACLDSSLLDSSTSRRLRTAAIAYCGRALADHGPLPELEAIMGELLWREGRHEEAMSYRHCGRGPLRRKEANHGASS